MRSVVKNVYLFIFITYIYFMSRRIEYITQMEDTWQRFIYLTHVWMFRTAVWAVLHCTAYHLITITCVVVQNGGEKLPQWVTLYMRNTGHTPLLWRGRM